MQTIALFFLFTVAIGGVGWVFVYPLLSGEKRIEQRKASAARSVPAAREARVTGKPRRDQIEETLKELDAKNKVSKRVPLAVRISQAGLSWSKRQFVLIAAGLGVLGFLLFLLFTGTGLFPALAVGFAAAFGLPFWILSFLKKRREAKFLNGFPDAVDVIVRGIKAGLPLMDSLRVVATDAVEPVRGEFRTILESQTVGVPLGEACLKLYERMPVPEANFFGIVILIQQKAGGNLSEALGNLSRVLRDRKRMKAKIQAMSMEAKASGAIIGSLPLVVMAAVYFTSPDYISLLWTQPLGQMLLAASAVWMSIGVMVMKKMINFDF